MKEWNDILGDASGNISEDKLKAYLDGSLSPAEQREVEEALSIEGMESDAVEGLQELSASDTELLTERINYKLQHQIKKEKYRNKRLYSDQKWTLLAVIIIILLCLIGYYIIKVMS